MSDVYTPPAPTAADLHFSGVYTPGDTTLNFGPDAEPLQSVLYQIWTDENYVFCATADGLGIIPIT
jgi:hypothetical protein